MQAIWAKDLHKEKNITITFLYRLIPEEDTALYLAASNLYRLFVNGELVGYGPARAAHGYSRLDNYSLVKWAGKETVLSIEVHSANVNNYYVIDEPPFFAAEIKCGETVIATATDFTAYHMFERVQKVRRFSFQRTFTEIYHLTNNPADFYAGNVERIPVEVEEVGMNQLLPRNVNYPKLNKLTAMGIECGTIDIDKNAEPWRDRAYLDVDQIQYKGFYPEELEEDSGEDVGQFIYSAIVDKKTDAMGPMAYQIFDFGRTLTGFFAIDVHAYVDTTLYITFDEVINDCGNHKEVSPFRNYCCNVIKYTLQAGKYELISFEANTARYATVVITDGMVKMNDFGMILYENPDAENFQFDYGDDKLNKIVRAAVHTFAQNAVDVLTDCPSRERAGWLCDSYFSARAEALFTGKNLVERNFLENYALCPQSPFLPEGMLPMCYPADHYDHTYIPNWAMWYILELHDYWKRTGDYEMLAMSKEKVYGLIKFFEKYCNEYGLLENLEGCVYIEWSKCNDAEYTCGLNFPSNMLWSAALEAAGEMYDDTALEMKGMAMKKMIRELAWDGEFFEENAVRDERGKLVKTGHITETCQYYAFYFDTASKEEYPELLEKMVTRFGPKRNVSKVYSEICPSNVIVGAYLRLEILQRYGYHEQVLSECCDFFLKMAELTGTLWEDAKLYASLNHGFASMAAVYIAECMENNIKEERLI